MASLQCSLQLKQRSPELPVNTLPPGFPRHTAGTVWSLLGSRAGKAGGSPGWEEEPSEDAYKPSPADAHRKSMWALWHVGVRVCLLLFAFATKENAVDSRGTSGEQGSGGNNRTSSPDVQGLCLQSGKPSDADEKWVRVLRACILVPGRSGFKSCGSQLPEG